MNALYLLALYVTVNHLVVGSNPTTGAIQKALFYWDFWPVLALRPPFTLPCRCPTFALQTPVLHPKVTTKLQHHHPSANGIGSRDGGGGPFRRVVPPPPRFHKYPFARVPPSFSAIRPATIARQSHGNGPLRRVRRTLYLIRPGTDHAGNHYERSVLTAKNACNGGRVLSGGRSFLSTSFLPW